MKFRFVNKVDGPVNDYKGGLIQTGDVIELEGHLAEKALKNPHYERVSDVTQEDGSEVFLKKTTKKKRGRPRKSGNKG